MNTQKSEHTLGLWLVALLFLTIPTSAQLTLNYKNYLVPPSFIASYQGAAVGGVVAPATGTNQTWDYSTIINTATSVSETYIPETNAAFATCRRQKIFSAYYGAGFQANAYEHWVDNTVYFGNTGQTINRTAYSLKAITGNTTDSLIVLAQNVIYGGNKWCIAYPLYYPKNWLYTYSYVINLQISLASQGLNHAPLQFATSYSTQCNVVGWGTMRIPTVNGPSNTIPSLMLKTNRTQVDSFFVNGTAANASVLSVLGFTQGQIGHQYLYRFKRAGLDKDLIAFTMDATFSTINSIKYDRTHYDLYCNKDNCHAKMCVNGSTTLCLAYSTNAANNAMLLNNAFLGECEATRVADDDIADKSIAKVYPNPSNNQFKLLLNDDGNSSATVHVYNFSGQLIYEFEHVNGMIEFGKELVSGIYFITVLSPTQKQHIKIVKTE